MKKSFVSIALALVLGGQALAMTIDGAGETFYAHEPLKLNQTTILPLDEQGSYMVSVVLIERPNCMSNYFASPLFLNRIEKGQKPIAATVQVETAVDGHSFQHSEIEIKFYEHPGIRGRNPGVDVLNCGKAAVIRRPKAAR